MALSESPAVPRGPAFFRCEPISIEVISEHKGRGVRAARAFRSGELIERAPVLPVPDEQWQLLEQTALSDRYVVLDDERCAIPLGYTVAFMNHSEEPNVEVTRHPEGDYLEVLALRNIPSGEELCFRYRAVWFSPA